MSRLFISYAHDDYDAAQRLYRDLAAAGHRPWVDKEDLLPGENWRRRIAEEIRSCKYFLALISSQSLGKRGFVQKELRLALEVLEEIPIDHRFLIPVRLNDCWPKDHRLAALHWVDLFPDYLTGLRRLLRSIGNRDTVASRPYCEVGVEVPSGIATWEDGRLFEYIDDVLWPEALFRAERDYEGMEEDDRLQTITQHAKEKLEAVAREHGFVDAWHRYSKIRGCRAT